MQDLLEAVQRKLTEEISDEGHLEARSNFMSSAAHSFLNSADRAHWRVAWPLLKPARLKKIWTDYARTGVVRDERGMADIAQFMFDSIARLDAANAISGHDRHAPRPEVSEEANHEFTDEEWDQFVEGMVHGKRGEWLVSDFGLPKLLKLAWALYDAEDDAQQQLLIVDQMLNVIHQRGDLSAMFVEGGRAALDFLRDQPVIDLKRH